MTLFERLGGAEGLRRVVDDLTTRLESDPDLAPLFVGVDGEGLRRHREHYLAAVLGGPEQYTGRGMREAHRPLGIDDAQFDRFLGMVQESARALGTAPGAADELAAFLRGLRPVIVDQPRR
jgi:hemoglobin